MKKMLLTTTGLLLASAGFAAASTL